MNLNKLIIKNNLVKLVNQNIKILINIDRTEKVVELVGFYKLNPHVKGRCVLRNLLQHLLINDIIDNTYDVEVMSPTPINGKTMNNTIRMYKNMGFNHKPPEIGKPNVLRENVKKLLSKLCTVPSPKKTKSWWSWF